MPTLSRLFATTVMAVLIIVAIWHWSQAALIYGKANLAQWLIQSAWRQTLVTGKETKPWPWADTWPVAKIIFPNKTAYYILAGSAGNSLAFGPGHLSNTALPGTQGSSIVGGHRDTHFSLLENIQREENIRIQNKKGEWKHYRVTNYWIANSLQQPLMINPDDHILYLITCYPFNAINPGGEQRFVVTAEPMAH